VGDPPVVADGELVGRVAGAAVRGTSGIQSAAASSPGEGYPSTAQPSTEISGGKLPVKKAVSTTTPDTTPGSPSRISAKSWPASRRRRVSQPS
jgi:hypothetical protein